MQKVLIAHSSEDFAKMLAVMLGGVFDVTFCSDGISALEHLRSLRPSALILDLMLPCKDGLTVLEDAGPARPAAILAMVRDPGHYILCSAESHGIGYIMRDPCDAKAVVTRVIDMVACMELPQKVYTEPTSEIVEQLLCLGLRPELDGFTQLQIGIRLYMQNPGQRLSKELYPVIAGLCNNDNAAQVERSIRSSIKSAWETRSCDAWESLFPGYISAPSNGAFISRIAAKLQKGLNTD